jgi:hypothetical protein
MEDVFHNLMGARKFRNLKVAATESLNLGKTNVSLSAALMLERKQNEDLCGKYVIRNYRRGFKACLRRIR